MFQQLLILMPILIQDDIFIFQYDYLPFGLKKGYLKEKE